MISIIYRKSCLLIYCYHYHNNIIIKGFSNKYNINE